MKVFRKEPGKAPELCTIANELDSLQEAVGGHIEVFGFAEDLAIICDEEGKLKGKPFNCELCGEAFVGTILFVGVDGEEFDDVSPRVENLFRILWQK